MTIRMVVVSGWGEEDVLQQTGVAMGVYRPLGLTLTGTAEAWSGPATLDEQTYKWCLLQRKAPVTVWWFSKIAAPERYAAFAADQNVFMGDRGRCLSSTLAHELGHVLGLTHESAGDDICNLMGSRRSDDCAMVALNQLQIDTIRNVVYGSYQR